MEAIEKFANYTREQMQIAYEKSPSIRSVWAPSCPFHCLSRYGEIDEAHANELSGRDSALVAVSGSFLD
jgi:hypothetical protein